MSITATFLGFSPTRFQQLDRDVNASLERLATGVRVQRPSDSPSQAMTQARLAGERNAFQTARFNAQRNDIFLDATAGHLDDVLGRLREARDFFLADPLAMQPTDQARVDGLLQGVQDVAENAAFAGKKLFRDPIQKPGGPETVTTTSTTQVPGTPLRGEILRQYDRQSGRIDRRMSFSQPLNDAVVIAAPPTYRGADEAHMRVTGVNANGFDFILEEWDHRDGNHTQETEAFLAMEVGSYELADGTRVEVGRATVTPLGARIDFENAFDTAGGSAPMVFTSVQTRNDPAAVASQITAVDGAGFNVTLLESSASDQVHLPETVGYIAIQPATSDLGGIYLEATQTTSNANGGGRSIDFNNNLSNATVFAATQESNNNRVGDVRLKVLRADKVSVEVDNEKSTGNFNTRASETMAVLAFDRPGVINAATVGETVTTTETVVVGQKEPVNDTGFRFAQTGRLAENREPFALRDLSLRKLGTNDHDLEELLAGGALDLSGDRAAAIETLDAAIKDVSTLNTQVQSYARYENASLMRIAEASEKAAGVLAERLNSIDEAEEAAVTARLQMQAYGFDQVFAAMENNANRVMQLLQSVGGVGGTINSVTGFASNMAGSTLPSSSFSVTG